MIYSELENKFDKVYKDPIILDNKNNKFILCHEPLTGLEIYNKEIIKEKNTEDIFVLFGHIHGRQKIKKFGIDVGIDAHNYFPISEKDIFFYKKAINEGFYDEQVFCIGNENLNINDNKNKKNKVFLGGIDHNNLNWKNELIKLLKIEYEENKKEDCNFQIYVLTHGAFPDIFVFSEITEDAINYKDKYVLCILEQNLFNEKEKESLNKMFKILEKYGIKCFDNLNDSANYVNNYN